MRAKIVLLKRLFPFSIRDFLVTTVIFFCATGVCALLQHVNSIDGFAFPVFVLAVLLVSRLTTGYLFGFLASVLGVVCTNFIFTYPYWAVNFTLSGYPTTFLVFLVVSIITCALTTQVRQQERLRAEGEKEKMRANLLRSVSHDIRTPLTSIVGSTSAVLENPGLSLTEQHELLEDVLGHFFQVELGRPLFVADAFALCHFSLNVHQQLEGLFFGRLLLIRLVFRQGAAR